MPSVSVGDTVRVKTQKKRLEGKIKQITQEQAQKKYELRLQKGKTCTLQSDVTKVEIVDTNETVEEVVCVS